MRVPGHWTGVASSHPSRLLCILHTVRLEKQMTSPGCGFKGPCSIRVYRRRGFRSRHLLPSAQPTLSSTFCRPRICFSSPPTPTPSPTSTRRPPHCIFVRSPSATRSTQPITPASHRTRNVRQRDCWSRCKRRRPQPSRTDDPRRTARFLSRERLRMNLLLHSHASLDCDVLYRSIQPYSDHDMPPGCVKLVALLSVCCRHSCI
mmetsp:Transcript_68684/g.161497  ORF Transcript_68684/g.161497 Transcript_68684/m.161497 type:complete len:204 (-) Transcript_68684:671-1282(-)